jgi:gamma-glutamylcysteine synthetase
MSPNRTHNPLNRVVDEVLKHLMDIIEVLLSEENSNNYIAFMNKVQEMCEQNEKNMMLRLEARLEDFKRDLGDNGIKNKKDDLGVK